MIDGTLGLGGSRTKCTCDIECHVTRGWSGECKCGCEECIPTDTTTKVCEHEIPIDEFCMGCNLKYGEK